MMTATKILKKNEEKEQEKLERKLSEFAMMMLMLMMMVTMVVDAGANVGKQVTVQWLALVSSNDFDDEPFHPNRYQRNCPHNGDDLD